MASLMMEGPVLWYLNRGSGAVTMVLLTLTVVLGVLSLGGLPARRVPRFVLQSLHRNAALLAFVLLAVHIASSVVDQYVDIRWWQAFVPVGATYEPLWLGLGAVAVDLMLVIAATSILRRRLSGPDLAAAAPAGLADVGALAHARHRHGHRPARRVVAREPGLRSRGGGRPRLPPGAPRGRPPGPRPHPTPAAIPVAARIPVRPRAEGPPMTVSTLDSPPSPVPFPDHVSVEPGPALLAGIERGPSLAAHRQQYGEPPEVSPEELHEALRRISLRGRGGAGFPFATKLDAVLQQRCAPGARGQHERG